MKVCEPLPATVLLLRVLSGEVDRDTCVLCLRGESLLAPSQAIPLSSGRSITIGQLISELSIAVVSGDFATKKICINCVDKMLSFYLFAAQCVRSASTLENLASVLYKEVANASEQFHEADSNNSKESYVGCSLNIVVNPDTTFAAETVQLQCSKCLLDFSTLKKLSAHQKEHIRSPYHLCRLCKRDFHGYHIFLSHFSTEHPDRPPPAIILQQTKSKNSYKTASKPKLQEDAVIFDQLDMEEHQFMCDDTEKHDNELKNYGDAHELSTLEEPASSKGMKMDIDEINTNGGLFACGKCSMDFPSIKELSLHLKVHGNGPYHKCEVCDKMFRSFSGLQTHFNAEHPEHPSPVPMKALKNSKVLCVLCNETFASRRTLEIHFFTEHGGIEDHLICKGCNAIYPKEAYSSHPCQNPLNFDLQHTMKSVKASVSSGKLENFEVSAPVAKKPGRPPRKNRPEANQNIDELRNEAGLFECRKCYSDFKTIEELSQHHKEHGKSPYHHCRYCDKTFNGFSALLAHFVSTHPGRPLPVPMMSQTLNQFTELYACDHCERVFKNDSYLRFHMLRMHGRVAVEQVCKVCNVKYYQNHTCRYTCSECPKYPCVHKKYLQAYMNAEEEEPRARHRCIECDFMYRNKDDLLDHVNKCHLLILPHMCDDCVTTWPSKKALRMHIACSHPVSDPLCPYCNVGVPKNLIEQHAAECETVEKPFGCEQCQGLFPSEESAKAHVKSHSSFVFLCHMCHGQCHSADELKVHIMQCRESSVGKEKSFPCLKCTLDFPSKEECISHEVSHPVDADYLCRGCNKSYPSKGKCLECMRTHKSDVTEKCPICSRLFNKMSLKTHMRVHGSKREALASNPGSGLPKTHMCDVCGSMHSTAYELKRHKDRHSVKRKCPHCMKLIQKRHIASHLAKHESGRKQPRNKLHCKQCSYTSHYPYVFESHINRMHRGIKPYSCDICEKKFYSKVYLRSHKTTHVNRGLECKECKQPFRSRKGFELHMMQHRGDFPHPCNLCDKKFVSASRKKEHQDRFHFEPQHRCTLCEKEFYRASSLASHVAIVHEGGDKRKRSVKIKQEPDSGK